MQQLNNLYKKRMTPFIKQNKKLKISDDQTNIDKYRLAANITEISYYIIKSYNQSLLQTFMVQRVI